MSLFQNLKNDSKRFENYLQEVGLQLQDAKLEETFEQIVTKKLQDFTLFTAKLKLLSAKILSLSPEVTEQHKSPDLLDQYGGVASEKVLELSVVKSAMQINAVHMLLSTPDTSLSEDLRELKGKINMALIEYREKEALLRNLHAILKGKEKERRAVETQWYMTLGDLRSLRDSPLEEPIDENEYLDVKLKSCIEKMNVMRWVCQRAVTARANGYDWLADPHGRLSVLKISRREYRADMFKQYYKQ